MVRLVRKLDSSLVVVVFVLYFYAFASPFRSSQSGDCVGCWIRPYEVVAASVTPLQRPTTRRPNLIKPQKDSSPRSAGASLNSQESPLSYCDRVSESMYAGKEPLYCIDHSYCTKIDDQPTAVVRRMTCGIKYDGSIRVCCNVSERFSPRAEDKPQIVDRPNVAQTVNDAPPQIEARSDLSTMQSTGDIEGRSLVESNETATVNLPDSRAANQNSSTSSWKFPKECGTTIYSEIQFETRIIGGERAQKNAWPWFALIMFQRRAVGRRSPECGGALISDRFVLTAAHCLLEQGRLSRPVRRGQVSVRLGEYDLKTNGDEIEVGVSRIIVHPKFSPKNFKNDIALIELDRKLTFGPSISPVCLPHDNKLIANMTPGALDGQTAWVIGFGQTSFNGRGSDQLRQVDLRLVEQNNCKEAFAHFIPITAEYVCASSQVSEPGLGSTSTEQPTKEDEVVVEKQPSKKQSKDSCKGDSGGPLMMQVPNTKSPRLWYIYGIVSFGYKCASADYPGVYTRVNHYNDWINSHL